VLINKIIILLTVTDDALLALMTLFGTVLDRALAIVDKPNSICELESPIGRKVVQVTGTSRGWFLFAYILLCMIVSSQQYIKISILLLLCRRLFPVSSREFLPLPCVPVLRPWCQRK